MTSLKQTILAAARADAIPDGDSGLWYVRKFDCTKPVLAMRGAGRIVTVPPGRWTYLLRWTDATIHLGRGECVMHDTPDELGTHLEFMLRARGRVLITGLGLGCVVRGTLANPDVEHVTVIEKSRDVLRLVEPWMPDDKRLHIIHDDAIRWARRNRSKFDCAWHDLWTDEAAGEKHLQLVHVKLLYAMCDRVPVQGAWAFPREFRRLMKPRGVI